MRTSSARAIGRGRVATRNTRAKVRANILLLDPAQHLSRGPSGLCARNAVHANHEENLGMGGGQQCDYKSVSGGASGVSACRSTRLDQSIGAAECAIDFRAGTVLGGLLHSLDDLANTGLFAAAHEFHVSSRHAQG